VNINEVLEKINECANIPEEYFDECKNIELTQNECKLLLVYITEIERKHRELFDVREQNRKLFKENMELIKELKLRGGKLVITDLEVKRVWK
jgi:hypothetical protein